MRLGYGISTRSTGKYRILMQRKGESLALAAGRRHKTRDLAESEALKLHTKYEPSYMEITDGITVYPFFPNL